jgi:hypothetical protein
MKSLQGGPGHLHHGEHLTGYCDRFCRRESRDNRHESVFGVPIGIMEPQDVEVKIKRTIGLLKFGKG